MFTQSSFLKEHIICIFSHNVTHLIIILKSPSLYRNLKPPPSHYHQAELTLRSMMSISEYFIPRTSTGMSLSTWGASTSRQMGCSARDNQNSHASRATVSSGSWVLISMYWNRQLLRLSGYHNVVA